MFKKEVQYLGIIVLLLFVSCSNTSKEDSNKKKAVEYFESIIKKADAVAFSFNNIVDVYLDYKVDSMKNRMLVLDKIVAIQQDSLAQMKDWNGETTLRSAAIEYIKQLQAIKQQDFNAIIDIHPVSYTLVTEAESAKMDSIANEIDAKVKLAMNLFLKAQADFAKKNNLKLAFEAETDSILKKQIDTSVIRK